MCLLFESICAEHFGSVALSSSILFTSVSDLFPFAARFHSASTGAFLGIKTLWDYLVFGAFRLLAENVKALRIQFPFNSADIVSRGTQNCLAASKIWGPKWPEASEELDGSRLRPCTKVGNWISLLFYHPEREGGSSTAIHHEDDERPLGDGLWDCLQHLESIYPMTACPSFLPPFGQTRSLLNLSRHTKSEIIKNSDRYIRNELE